MEMITTIDSNHDGFNKDGFLYVPSMIDVAPITIPPPTDLTPNDESCPGTIYSYNTKVFKALHTEIRLKIEKILGKKLYNTYFYDRFYFPSTFLPIHVDRHACEVSVTVHVSTNIPGDHGKWPIYFRADENTEVACVLLPGDACIYKGCDSYHWRNHLSSPFQDMDNGTDVYYYHQVFFHYVYQDGYRAHHRGDLIKDPTNK